ncbi:ABC transporter substrate-binding protein [uncultured Cohaesibacter sp.]|uniref:ABC transporter substrate-binding protein n=1 Tax=uncultured Cohaesibacter sp. TaxID=1002546 RepID=UPI0029C6EEA0|nr:ABC transporter substrate-binding protein [uncultured Cohaesibacter sp.]
MRLAPFLGALLYCTTALAQSHIVTDSVGREVELPEAPARIVSLNEPLLTTPMLELGLPVVGSYGRLDGGETFHAVDFAKRALGSKIDVSKIGGIGLAGNIDVEKIRALKPDVIVGTESNTSLVQSLSTIAPVYLQKSRTSDVQGVSSERDLAALFGKTDVFDQLWSGYQARLDTIRASLPANPESQTYLGIIILDQLAMIGDISGAVQAINDLGYKRYDIESDGERSGYGKGFAIPISSEMFARLNPDLLILMNSYVVAEQGEEAIRARLDAIVPGWDRFLKPEKEGRVLFLDAPSVVTPTLSSAHNLLDALEDWAESKK